MTRDLRWTHLTPDTVEQWADLTNHLAKVDGTEEYYEVEDLAEELEESGFDPQADSWAVWDGDRMVGYGQLRVGATPDGEGRIRCNLGGGVHPDYRGRGIGRELIARQEQRARESVAERHPGTPFFYRASGELEGSDARRLLTRMGYAVVRHFNALARELPGEDLTVPQIEGVQFVTPVAEQEEPVRVAHNAAFVDHWGSAPSTPERWHDYWTARSNRPALSTLAVDEEGRVLSYVIAGQWVPRELYIALVGTVPEGRGRGLAAHPI